jgi:hypothetical protein
MTSLSKGKQPAKSKTGRASAKSTGTVASEVAEVDYTRLQSISKLVQLKNVEMMGLSFVSHADPRSVRFEGASRSEFALNLIDARWHRRDQGTHFEIVLGYEVIGLLRSEGADEGLPLFRLAASWVVTYSLPETFQRPDNHEEAAADFVVANGQVNVFPFLRQLVVETTAKAGWPPLFLPVFRIPKSRRKGLVRNAPAW